VGEVEGKASGALDQVLVEQGNSIEQAWLLFLVLEFTERLTRQCQISA
jgi:hypothetical protein